jgi:hypothetical protein
VVQKVKYVIGLSILGTKAACQNPINPACICMLLIYDIKLEAFVLQLHIYNCLLMSVLLLQAGLCYCLFIPRKNKFCYDYFLPFTECKILSKPDELCSSKVRATVATDRKESDVLIEQQAMKSLHIVT